MSPVDQRPWRDYGLAIHRANMARKRRAVGDAADVAHLALGLAGEAGEVCNILKKVDRGDAPLDAFGPPLAAELADVAIYANILSLVALGRPTAQAGYGGVTQEVEGIAPFVTEGLALAGSAGAIANEVNNGAAAQDLEEWLGVLLDDLAGLGAVVGVDLERAAADKMRALRERWPDHARFMEGGGA